MSNTADITIIGAGAIGLAIAAEVAREGREVYQLEKNDTFGLEITSRTGALIQDGIFFPPEMLRAKFVVAGNRLIYELCGKYGVPHKRLGMLMVATNDKEAQDLQIFLQLGQSSGVEDLRILSRKEILQLEPNISGVAALYSPAHGTIDPHGLLQYYLSRATEGGIQIAYQSEVIGIKKVTDGYKVTVKDSSGISSFTTRVLINCTGLNGEKVAALAGIDTAKAGYQLYSYRAENYAIGGGKNTLINGVLDTVPTSGGVHFVPQIDGRILLGFEFFDVAGTDYSINDQHKLFFYDSARTIAPFIEWDDLEPDFAAIGPRILSPEGELWDFIVREESDKGLPGFINAIGIAGPGLTCSPAIAEHVGKIVTGLLGK